MENNNKTAITNLGSNLLPKLQPSPQPEENDTPETRSCDLGEIGKKAASVLGYKKLIDEVEEKRIQEERRIQEEHRAPLLKAMDDLKHQPLNRQDVNTYQDELEKRITIVSNANSCIAATLGICGFICILSMLCGGIAASSWFNAIAVAVVTIIIGGGIIIGICHFFPGTEKLGEIKDNRRATTWGYYNIKTYKDKIPTAALQFAINLVERVPKTTVDVRELNVEWREPYRHYLVVEDEYKNMYYVGWWVDGQEEFHTE